MRETASSGYLTILAGVAVCLAAGVVAMAPAAGAGEIAHGGILTGGGIVVAGFALLGLDAAAWALGHLKDPRTRAGEARVVKRWRRREDEATRGHDGSVEPSGVTRDASDVT